MDALLIRANRFAGPGAVPVEQVQTEHAASLASLERLRVGDAHRGLNSGARLTVGYCQRPGLLKFLGQAFDRHVVHAPVHSRKLRVLSSPENM